MLSFIVRFIEPKSCDGHDQRRERILNILLVSSLFLVMVSTVSSLLASLFSPNTHVSQEVSWCVHGVVMVILGLFLFLSKKGYCRWASYAFIGFYFFPTTHALFVFGTDLPQGLVMYALIIVLSGILIGTRFAYFTTCIMAIILFGITYAQQTHILAIPIREHALFSLNDVVNIIASFFVISLVAWLSNREMEQALYRAQQSECDLKKERDLLEVRIQERTQELHMAQMEKMMQLSQFAEFGKIAAGLIHDLINPLMTLSLNLHQASATSKEVASSQDVDRYMQKALLASECIEKYIIIARKQLQFQDEVSTFSPMREICQLRSIFEYKLQKTQVQLYIRGNEMLSLQGAVSRFHQAMANILSNALDAYDTYAVTKNIRRHVDILVQEDTANESIKITVRDFGRGIQEDQQAFVFDPFFSTKKCGNGMGIGLFLVKQIIEHDFAGSIAVESTLSQGTLFTILLPLKQTKTN